jgi:deazaflavin-dependent oxidoreductase (nitroreductase family)
MPSDRLLKAANAVHRGALRLTGGRIGWHVAGMAAVELTTTGRTSGRRRTVMLTSPHQDGDSIVLVASRGGDDHHPAWFLNLCANSNVEARTGGGPRRAMTARPATSEERARLWPVITSAQPRYAGYQARTEREIPVVLLEPAR